MQIFLTSHTHSSSRISFLKKEQGNDRGLAQPLNKGGFIQPSSRAGFTPPSKTAGFTLIELLICCAIIGIITAIVLLKYSSFDSTTLLKGAAYEVALNLREAQVKSVSVVRNDNNNFNNPYGISFTPYILGVNVIDDSKKYQTFYYKDDETIAPTDRPNPKYNISDDDTLAVKVDDTVLDRGMYIKKVCAYVGGAYNCNISRLDITFRRPEFTALFYAPEYDVDPKVISKAKIEISSTNNVDAGFTVEVTRLGQISIKSI